MPSKIDVAEIRDVLTKQIRLVVKGKVTPSQLQAISNATGKMLSSVRIEMDYAKLTGKQPDVTFITE